MRNRKRPPLSPEAAALLSLTPLSRRTMMRGAVASGALLAAGGALAACGTEGAQQTEATCVSDDLSSTEKTIAFSNWPQYIDVDENDESKRPTLEAFQAQSGIAVTYTEDINDNNEFFGKVQNQLAACQTTERDIIVLTDWMTARMIRLGWVQKLDKAKMPNVEKNLLKSLRGRPFDKNDEYAVPWQSGLTGMAYNGNVTGEIRTIDELLTRPDLKGKVTALSEMRDTDRAWSSSRSATTRRTSPTRSSTTRSTRSRRRSTPDRSAGSPATTTPPSSPRATSPPASRWSGDVLQLGLEDPKVKFVSPDSGIILFSDNSSVPNKSAHKANAEELFNYYYDPKVAAELAAYVNYICPVRARRRRWRRSTRTWRRIR